MHSQFKAEPFGFLRGMAHRVQPLGSEVLNGAGWYLIINIEDLGTANSYPMQSFKVRSYALLGYVAINPMPPYLRFGNRRRALKSIRKNICAD